MRNTSLKRRLHLILICGCSGLMCIDMGSAQENETLQSAEAPAKALYQACMLFLKDQKAKSLFPREAEKAIEILGASGNPDCVPFLLDLFPDPPEAPTTMIPPPPRTSGPLGHISTITVSVLAIGKPAIKVAFAHLREMSSENLAFESAVAAFAILIKVELGDEAEKLLDTYLAEFKDEKPDDLVTLIRDHVKILLFHPDLIDRARKLRTSR